MSSPLIRNGLAAARYLAPGIGLFMSGSILTLSYFSIPILRAAMVGPTSKHPPSLAESSTDPTDPTDPANARDSHLPNASTSTTFALAQTRALFSSGSHIYPPAIILTSSLFFILAYALPSKRALYAVAGTTVFAIAPFTTRVMVPLCNGRLIELDERRKRAGGGVGESGGKDGKDGKEVGVEIETERKEVEELLRQFEWVNAVRAGLGLVGSLVGLWASVF